jgi:hypothetical protein
MDNVFGIIENKELIKYPSDPRYDFTNVSFPLDWEGGIIENVKYVKLTKTEPPADNKFGWNVVEVEPRYNKKTDTLIQAWDIQFVGFIKFKILVSMKRYAQETSGLNIDGNVFKTDRESQTKYSLMALHNVKTNWKINEQKFVYADMKIVDQKVREFVEACFTKEKELFEIIDTNDLKLISKTDFELCWPNNGQEQKWQYQPQEQISKNTA